MQQRGTPFPPQLSLSFVGPASSNLPGDTKTIELQALFAAVIHSGGSQRAAQIPGFWAVIASRLGLKVGPPDGSQSAPDAVPSPGEVPDRLSAFYRDRLSAFEQFWMSRMPQRQASGQSGAAGLRPHRLPTRPRQILMRKQRKGSSQVSTTMDNHNRCNHRLRSSNSPRRLSNSKEHSSKDTLRAARPSRPGAPGQVPPASLPANFASADASASASRGHGTYHLSAGS